MKNLYAIFFVFLCNTVFAQGFSDWKSTLILADYYRSIGNASGDNFVNQATHLGYGGEFLLRVNIQDYGNLGIEINSIGFNVEDQQYTGSINKVHLNGFGVVVGYIYPLSTKWYLDGSISTGVGRISEQGSRSLNYLGGRAAFKYRLFKHIFVSVNYCYKTYNLSLTSAPSDKNDFFNSTGVHTIGIGLSIN